ncbi:MAG TPA: ABC transporter permease [Gemmatimonadaceae bacterium]
MTDRKPDGASSHDVGFMPKKPAAEVDIELQFHLEQRIQANVARGMSPEAARLAALERFGNVDDVRDECTQMLAEDRRAEARRNWLDDLRLDAHFALRSALRAPLFSALAVATLALGIGANAAVFGTVKSVLLDALPYGNADRLMRIYSPFGTGDRARGALSAGTVSDIRERQHSFESLAAFFPSRDGIYLGDQPQIVKTMFIEPGLLHTLGVSPLRGAGFRDEDANHDTTTVVMISSGAWQRLFGGKDDAVGKMVRLNGIARTIVGIMPRGFVPPQEDADFFQPLAMAPLMRNPVNVRGSHNAGFVGLLKPGVSAEMADRELHGIGLEIEQLFAKDNRGFGLTGVPLRDDMVGDTRTPLIILLASAALVLLIMCANLAGALLSRTISRRKEFAVRVALGAGRGRLVRQLLTESILLSTAGGVAGLLLAMLGLRLLRGLALTSLPTYAGLHLDAGAIIVTSIVALATGLAFGAGPAISVGRADPQGTLRDESRSTSESRRTRRARSVLVAAQIALCVSLLAAAGLLGRSLWTITMAPLGFDTERLLTFSLQLPNAKYPTVDARVRLHDQLEEIIRALPGVSHVAFTSAFPTKVTNTNGLFIEMSPWGADEPVPFIATVRVTDDYFRTLSIPLLKGRDFSTIDRDGAPPVLIINEAMARKYWPKGDAVGARVHVGPPDPSAPWITIVGIVSNMRNDPTRLTPEPMMFFPQRQQPFGDNVIIRTAGDPTAITASVRRTIAAIDPTLPMYNVATLDDVVSTTFAPRRLPVVLMTAFGGLALLLASVGVYAMFATMAAAREREIGVRIALGATRRGIASLILLQGGTWMLAGLAVGGVGVVFVGRFLRTQLFGVPELDPLAIGAAVIVLVVCAGLALTVPIRRATRVDPIMVLR